MIMCDACFNDDKIKTLTTFTVDYKGCIIIVKNVPCYECQICGEITFSDEVSEKLETLVTTAKNALDSVFQEIALIDYAKAA